MEKLQLPIFEAHLRLSGSKIKQSRTAYTLLDLFGAVGGFAGAVYMIFGVVIGYYSNRMYQREIAKEIKVAVKHTSPTLSQRI